ncbi:DUF268 domain-containing protein [Patescibacteria group bacterium]
MKRLYYFARAVGIEPIHTLLFFYYFPDYIRDYIELRKQIKNYPDFKIHNYYPILWEKYLTSGAMSGHYFHQDLRVARRIFLNKPEKHVDIGSRIDGFVAHVAVFRKIEVFDIRPQNSKVKNIVFRQADLMKIPSKFINYCDSISSLHAIEHFGLGRYSDPINANGHKIGLDNIYKILKHGGRFYLSVPIGKQRIDFNAHRVFNIAYLLKLVEKKYKIDNFSYVDDNGNFHENILLTKAKVASNFNCYYGCGLLEMIKI